MSIAEKLNTIAENEPKVYEAGQKTKMSDIMDAWQYGGYRTKYPYAFYQVTSNFIYPKYDICPEGDNTAFARQTLPPVIDLVERLNECGIKMDFSKLTTCTYLFYAGAFSHLPEIDVRNAYGTHFLMFGQYVVTVDKLILNTTGQKLTDTFGYAENLENIVIEGVIGGDNVNIKYSPKLTLESLKSILTALKDYSGTDEEYAYTVSLLPENWAVLEADGATAPNGLTWVEYIYAKGWNKA